MPWQVPITVDGLEYPVTFNTEEQPTQQDLDEAVQQILSQRGQAPQLAGETPGYLSQLGSALGLGYRQMKSGVGATFNALTGDTADVAAEMAEMSKLQREQQAAQTPEDLEFMRSLEEAEKGFEQAQGPLESIGALAQYPAAVFAQPGAAFKTAVQSAPNALISGATSLAGYGLGGLVGGVAGIETGPGAILTGLAGATAVGALSNTLMDAGPSIFDVLNERTQGAASNMTADEIAAYLQQNPDIVEEGLKIGAIRGSVIGAVEALGVKGSGRLLTMPERAAARAVQKELMAQGVDVASKEAVDKALLDPALRASTKAVAETAKNQFSSAGNMARLVGASAIETGAAGAGELAAQAAAGQDISTKEAFLEMMGEVALSLPMAATTKALEGAKYMLNPALVSDLGKASAENLAATGSTAAAEAQEGFNEAIELAMLPFTREDIRGISTPAQVAEEAGAEVTPLSEGAVSAGAGLNLESALIAKQERESSGGTTGAWKPVAEDEPPVQSGFVRFYHAGDPVISKGDRRWLSPDRAWVSGFRPGLPVSFVDVPVSDPQLKKSFDDSGTPMSSPFVNFEADEQTTAKLQPLSAGVKAAIPQQPATSPNTPKFSEEALTTSPVPETPPANITADTLPPIPEGMIRLTHGTSGQSIRDVLQSGRFNYSKQVVIDATTDSFGNNQDLAERLNTNMAGPMSREKFGDKVIIMDVPLDEYRKLRSFSADNPGFVPANRIVAVYDSNSKKLFAPELPQQSTSTTTQQTQEDAAPEIPLEESLRQEPQDRAESREAEETGAGDQLLRPETGEGEGEVAPIEPTVENIEVATPYVTGNGGQRGEIQSENGDDITVEWRDGTTTTVKKSEVVPRTAIEQTIKNKTQISQTSTSSSDKFTVFYYDENGEVHNIGSFLGETEDSRDRAFEKALALAEKNAREHNHANVYYREKKLPVKKSPSTPQAPTSATTPTERAATGEAQKEPITPPGEPTTATEGMVTPGGVAGPGTAAEAQSEQPDAEWAVLSPTQWASTVGKSVFESRLGKKLTKKQAADFVEATRKGETVHKLSVEDAVTRYRNPVSAAAVDTYGIKLPEGYTRQGDLYVFQPQTKQAAEKQTPVPLREGTGAAGVVQSEPVEGSIPTVEKVSPETESESSEKLDTVAQIDRLVQAGAKPEEMDKFIKSLTDEQFNELVASEAFDVDPKLAIKPNDTYDAKRIKRRKFVDVVNASTKEVRKTAQQVFQEEEAAAKKQQAGEKMRSKAIDSIIGAAEKKKRKFGQVTNSDAIAAVAMLVSSKDVPGVLTTWTGTKEDFLRDPANQLADPEIYARIKAGELVEGFFNKGRAYVFLDGIGVSDEDMLRGEQMSVTPQVAAVRRVLLHESLVHRGIHGLPLRHRRLILNWVRQNSTPAELDELAKLYTEYANWRNSDYEFEALAEELLAKKVDSLTEIPKDGPMAKLMDILRQIWDFIVGYKREPTLSDLKSVIKLLKSGAEALANDRLKDGGEVKLSIRAFHGTPHKVDKFTTAKIGTGEGAQAYGWGLYFAQNKGVAKSYQEALSGGNRLLINGKTLEDATVNLTPTQIKWAQEVDHYVDEMQEPLERAKGYVREGIEDALERKSFERFASTFGVSDSSGNLYTVELLPDEDEFLDWDKPLSEQSEKVKNILSPIVEELIQRQIKGLEATPSIAALGLSKKKLRSYAEEFLAPNIASGMGLYDLVRGLEGNKRGGVTPDDMSRIASEYLASIGIPGIRYLDADSRGKEDGTRNFVIFDENLVRILEENGQSLTPPEGSDIRFSRPQFSSETSAAFSAGSEAARSTLYSERDMDIREAIRRAYEAMPKTNSVAVPIGELFAKTEELMPGVTQEEFSLVLQDLFEDNGAVLQEGDVVEPLTEQDRRYLALAQDEDANREELQRMVDEAARAAGYNRKGVRFGFYVNGVPLPPSLRETNFGPGYYVAEDATIDLSESGVSVHKTPNKKILQELGLKEDEVEFISGPVYVKAQNPIPSNFTELEKKIIEAEIALESSINEAFIESAGKSYLAGEPKYLSLEELTKLRGGDKLAATISKFTPDSQKWQNTVAKLLRDKKLGGLYPYDSKRGISGRTLVDKSMSSELVVPFANQIKSADPVTRDDQGRIIPLSRRFDTGSDIRGQINVTTPEGKRAGFVVVMPRAAKASRIKAEDASDASKTFQADIIEAGKGRIDTASYQGNTLKSTEAPDHNENAPELYRDAAISLVDSLLSQGHSITDIADSFQDPEFRVAVGLLGNKAINPNVAQQAELFIGAEIQNRLENSFNKERNPAKKRIIEKTLKNHKAYYTTATGIGQNLNAVGALQQDPRFKWMFMFNEAEKEMADKAKEKLDTITGGGTQPVTDTVNQSEEAAADEATKQIEESVEEDEDAALFAEGEASLQGEAKSIWERMKDILRKIAFLDRLDKRDASSAKASLSEADKNTLFSLPKEERAKKRAEFVAEFIALGKIFMGEGKASDTPAQKATRQKRKKMVDTAKKRAEAGKEIEVTRIQIQSFMDELMPGYTERKSIVNEVGDALLKAAEQRKAKPRQRTAIQDFVSAIKQTLMANIRGDKISAEQPSLGMLLAKTFAQQGSEAEAFAAAWANGRKKVRGMLAEMGVEEGNLDAELDAIMPPTPTLAYAPAAARKAVSNAMREAGLMRSDLLNDPAASKKAIMEKFDEAAKSANLTEEGWDKKGRALAEKAVDESIVEAKMAQERAKKVAKILSEQAEKPVSLEDFGAKLAEFRFKKDKIAELFNRAKKLAERKIQMANDQAIRVLLAAENKLAQSAFFNAAEKPDTIVKAFREQVEEPMERDAFKKRMEKMLVTPEMADKLFDRAARERDNARWKKAQDLLEGPNALQNLLRQMNMARPGEQAPFSKQISWREILSQKAKTVEEYRQRIFDAISANEAFQNLSDEQKGRLSDLFSEAWESKRTDILDRMLEREIERKRREGSLSEAAAKVLQKSRNKIIELANLGGFDNDDLMKVLGEKFGIKTGFSEAEKARISELADKLQDETLNPAKRNKLAMEFAVTLAGASEIPVAEIIANWWTSSVLFGPQTIFSIGAAFVNGAYSITTIGTRRMLADLTRGDVKGAIEESILMLQGIAKYLGAFKQAGRRAWSYLWTGNVDVLGAAANDILGEINSLEELKRFKRHKLLAENLAKDPRALRRYVGMYLRFVNRLLTSLDAFNVMVTKAGTASLALRMSGMSTDNIIKAEKMLNLKSYKDQVIRDYFDNKAPTTQAEKALVDSYAEAEMYRAVDQLGGKMENADYLASESAMTMNPTGLGGFFYRSITGLDSKMKKAAEDYLEKAKKDWTTEKDLESTLFLGLAYLRQFAVQNLGGVAGYKFIRFASNKFNQGISYLPMVGLLRTLEAKGDDIKGKEAFIETIHRNQVIGAVLTLAAIAVVKALEDEPDDEERGNFWNGGWQNLTPDQKKQMLAKGQKEYTMGFKFNGRWYVFNYQNWPLNQVLAAIGSMSDQIRFSPKQWEEKGPLSKSLAGIVSGLKSTLEIPALSQLGTLVGNRLASKDPTEQTVDRLSNVAAGWVGGFVPRILKDLDFATQPELRKYKTLWEKTASHIPIYRRYVGEDYYDILGQPIKRNVIPGSREFMMGPTEPEYKILGALNSRNIFLTPANAEYRMVGKGRNRRRLTQEEADAYSLETGKGYRQMLLRYGQRALQMPTERARAFLSDKADEVRDRALKKVFRR